MDHPNRQTTQPTHTSRLLVSLVFLATFQASGMVSTPTAGIGPFAEPGGIPLVVVGDEGVFGEGLVERAGEEPGRAPVELPLEPAGIGPFAEPGG